MVLALVAGVFAAGPAVPAADTTCPQPVSSTRPIDRVAGRDLTLPLWEAHGADSADPWVSVSHDGVQGTFFDPGVPQVDDLVVAAADDGCTARQHHGLHEHGVATVARRRSRRCGVSHELLPRAHPHRVVDGWVAFERRLHDACDTDRFPCVLAVGQGAWLNTVPDSLTQVRSALASTDGAVVYSYQQNAVEGSEPLLPILRATVFTDPAPAPALR